MDNLMSKPLIVISRSFTLTLESVDVVSQGRRGFDDCHMPWQGTCTNPARTCRRNRRLHGRERDRVYVVCHVDHRWLIDWRDGR
jgi:hypothetical protein